MVRTQIQLNEDQAAALKSLAIERQVSMAELIRCSVDQYIQREVTPGSREAIVARAKNAVGRFSSGRHDISVNHDEYLADAFGQA